MPSDFDALLEASAVDTAPTLERLRATVAEFRDATREASDLEERLKEVRERLTTIERTTLPNLFAEAGVASMSLDAEGNHPAVEAKLSDFYRANIASGWDDLRRKKGFETLERLGLAPLIKVEVTARFGRGESDEARQIAEMIRATGHSAEVENSVSHMTLTSAVKELHQQGNLPGPEDLDAIGAVVGKQVKLKFK